MDAVIIERIFKMMEGIDSDPNYVAKSWVLGQIAGLLSKKVSALEIIGCEGMSVEILSDLLSELEISYGEIVCNNNVYTVPLVPFN